MGTGTNSLRASEQFTTALAYGKHVYAYCVGCQQDTDDYAHSIQLDVNIVKFTNGRKKGKSNLANIHSKAFMRVLLTIRAKARNQNQEEKNSPGLHVIQSKHGQPNQIIYFGILDHRTYQQ